MVNLWTLAFEARQKQLYFTPYRTGFLARSVGEIFNLGSECSYKIFSGMYNADYGKILNEAPIIHYKTRLRGQEYSGSYINTHYQWVDKFFGICAFDIDTDLGTIRG